MKRKIYRQGDVVLVEAKTAGKKRVVQNKFILAYGEATGHNHQILADQINLFEGRRRYVGLEQEAELIHQQHNPIRIARGKYLQVQEREVDHFSKTVRKVMD